MDNKPLLPEDYKKKLIKAIEYHYPEARIILFGSWATGKAKIASDIDLAIDIGKKVDLYEMDRIEKTIENLDLRNMVDVVDMHTIPKELKDNILKDGIIWKG